MAKGWIGTDEWYPVYEPVLVTDEAADWINSGYREPYEIPDDLFAEWKRVNKAFDVVQRRLKDVMMRNSAGMAPTVISSES